MKQTWREDPQVQDDPALAAALENLAECAGQPVDDLTRARTVRAMATAAGGDATGRTGRWARRGRRAAGLAAVKVLAAASVAAATTGGLATQGMLPDTVQETLHDLGVRIGLQLPPGSPPPAVDPDPGADQAPSEPPAADHDLPDDADVRRPGPAVRGGHGRPPTGPGHGSRPDEATPPDHASRPDHADRPEDAGSQGASEPGQPQDPPAPPPDDGDEGGPPGDVTRGPAAPAGR